MPEKGEIYTVLIADDHPLVRAGVRACLEQADHVAIVGECQKVEEVAEQLAAHSPRLLILDIMLGQACSLDWLARFHAASPASRILILSALKEGEKLQRLHHPAIAGFLLKDEAAHNLLQAVRVLRTGGVWFSQPIAAEMRRLAQVRREQRIYKLTPREEQVLALVSQAKDNATIARELGLSKHTVRRHLTLIFQKMDVRNRIDAILRRAEHVGIYNTESPELTVPTSQDTGEPPQHRNPAKLYADA